MLLFMAAGIALGRGWLSGYRQPAPAHAWSGAEAGVETLAWTPEMRPVGVKASGEDPRAGLYLGGKGAGAPTVRMEMASGTPAEIAAAYRRQSEAEGWRLRENLSGRIHKDASGSTLAFRRGGRMRIVFIGKSASAGELPAMVFETALAEETPEK